MQRSTLVAIAACGVAIVVMILFMSGSQVKIQLAALIISAPLALALAWKRPAIFPYGCYAFLVPFDNLLMLSNFGTGTKLLGLLAGAALLWWTIRRRVVVAPSRSLLVWALLLGWMGLTLLWTSDPANGMREFGSMLQILLLYAVVSVTPLELKDFTWILRGIVGGGIAAAIFGIYVFHHQNPIEAQLQHEFGRVTIVMGQSAIDVNHFANALLLPIALLLVVALNEQRPTFKIAYILGLVAMIAAVYQTQSREALLGFGAMLLYLAVVSRKRLQLIAVMVIGGVLVVVNPQMWQRFAEATSTGGAGRTSIWAVAIQALKHHFLFGSGLGSFANSYDEAYLQVFQRFSVGWSRDPHNLLIHYSVELGIAGAALAVACWLLQFRMMKTIAAGSQLWDMRIAATAALVALSVTAMFIDLFTYKYVWLLFALIAQLRALAHVDPELSAVHAVPPRRFDGDVTDLLWPNVTPSHAR